MRWPEIRGSLQHKMARTSTIPQILAQQHTPTMSTKNQELTFSKAQIDQAGRILIGKGHTTDEFRFALQALSNFRADHAYPINTFQATLRYKLKVLGIQSLTSQRLKRAPSILHKLKRFKSMRLSRMQDIGGLRAIVPSIKDVYRLLKAYEQTKFQHQLKNSKDYIYQPKPSGYRSLHLVYQYRNVNAPEYNGLMVELQFRTRLQHTWATAVETVGTFINHSLKSSQGPDEWLKFFELVGNAFAHLEGTNSVPGYESMSKKETYAKVKYEANRLNILETLNAFRLTVKNVETDRRQGSIHLVILDLEEREVYIRSFPKLALYEATEAYAEEEAKITERNKRQVVLVSSTSIDSLKKAYPSYFLDTQDFVKKLEQIIKFAD